MRGPRDSVYPSATPRGQADQEPYICSETKAWSRQVPTRKCWTFGCWKTVRWRFLTNAGGSGNGWPTLQLVSNLCGGSVIVPYTNSMVCVWNMCLMAQSWPLCLLKLHYVKILYCRSMQHFVHNIPKNTFLLDLNSNWTNVGNVWPEGQHKFVNKNHRAHSGAVLRALHHQKMFRMMVALELLQTSIARCKHRNK